MRFARIVRRTTAWSALALLCAAMSAHAAVAQTASPSPAAGPAASTAYDGHYTGTSTSPQGCSPGSFDLTVDHGAISGTARFSARIKTVDTTLVFDASGRIDAAGVAKALFHTDDSAMPVNRRDLPMSGNATDDGIKLSEGGQTCAHTVLLTRSRN